jgi:hypothetical protein
MDGYKFELEDSFLLIRFLVRNRSFVFTLKQLARLREGYLDDGLRIAGIL